MNSHELDRRCRERRAMLGGGRRSGDREPRRQSTPPCPSCRATGALLAGEAEGGWWFVCGECDQMWDERARVGSPAAVAC